jgi:hypothetical protein
MAEFIAIRSLDPIDIGVIKCSFLPLLYFELLTYSTVRLVLKILEF